MSRKWLTTLGVAATAAVATLAFVAASAASTSHRTTVPTAAPSVTLLAAPLPSTGADGATSVTPMANACEVVCEPFEACTVML